MIPEVQIPDCLRAIGAYGIAGSLCDLPRHALDAEQWAELVVAVDRARLTGLLVAAIEDDAMPVTASQAAQATTMHLRWLAHALRLEDLLVSVVGHLAEVGIQIRVLKGSGAAHLDYPDPSWRTFADLDILVPPAEFDRAIQALTDRGARRRFPQPRPGFDRRFARSVCVVFDEQLEVDVHRTIGGGAPGYRVEVADLWASAADSYRIAGRSLDTLGSDERLLHACYHTALGDVPPRLMPQRDVVQLILCGTTDTDRVLELADRWRGRAVVAHAISTAWESYRVADVVALSAWAQRYRPTAQERREIAILTAAGRSYATQAIGAIRSIKGVGDRARFVSALLFPQRDYLDGRHAGFVERLRYGVHEARGAAKTSRSSEVALPAVPGEAGENP